jgi:hypothetical protein
MSEYRTVDSKEEAFRSVCLSVPVPVLVCLNVYLSVSLSICLYADCLSGECACLTRGRRE